MRVLFKKIHPDAVLPKRKSLGSAGADLCSVESYCLGPGKVTAVHTGLQFGGIRDMAGRPPLDTWELQVRPRSGLAMKHGVFVVNSPGTIDMDYRGELIVLLSTMKNIPYNIHPGDRIAQLVLSKVGGASYGWTVESDLTERGDGGFGSTGK